MGLPDGVQEASSLVRQELEPHNKITLKMDVSWTHHSHIIGKAGSTIKQITSRTGQLIATGVNTFATKNDFKSNFA